MDDILLTDGEIKSEVVAALSRYPNEFEMDVLRGLCRAQVRKTWEAIIWELEDASDRLKDIRGAFWKAT